jgi:hypothetical protein
MDGPNADATTMDSRSIYPPGPWDVQAKGYYFDVVARINDGLICSISKDPGDEGEAERLARLIAAAPRLLAVLLSAPLPSVQESTVDFLGRFYDWYEDRKEAIVQAIGT